LPIQLAKRGQEPLGWWQLVFREQVGDIGAPPPRCEQQGWKQDAQQETDE
jgi:hypothetical protein